MVAEVDSFLKVCGFTHRGSLITQKLTAVISLDKEKMPEFLAHADELGRQVRKNKNLNFLNVITMGWCI